MPMTHCSVRYCHRSCNFYRKNISILLEISKACSRLMTAGLGSSPSGILIWTTALENRWIDWQIVTLSTQEQLQLLPHLSTLLHQIFPVPKSFTPVASNLDALSRLFVTFNWVPAYSTIQLVRQNSTRPVQNFFCFLSFAQICCSFRFSKMYFGNEYHDSEIICFQHAGEMMRWPSYWKH